MTDSNDDDTAGDLPRPSREARLKTVEPAEERIAKVIARAGIASRRDVEAMIAQGRVSLNGEVLASPAVNVTAADAIVVDGEPLPRKERTRLWLYHKPRGLVTTARDPQGRPTVFESLPEDLPRVVAIGRLDISTEGLLLLTNDGGLAKVIAHPQTGWMRRYKARAYGEVTQADLDKLRNGVSVDDMDYGPVEARLDRVQGDNVWLTLGLREGKNREVKRILEHLGLNVNRLIRLSFGPFQLGEIEPGLVEEVRTRVLKDQLGTALAAEAGVDFVSPVREPVAPFGSPKAGLRRDAAAPRRRDEDRKLHNRSEDRRLRVAPPGPPDARRPPRRDRLEPKLSVWRAGEGEGDPRAHRRTARRGADPGDARRTSGERPRQRVGAIDAGEGRKVRVERLVSAPKEHRRPHRTPRPPPGAEDRLRRPRGSETAPGDRQPPFRQGRDMRDRPASGERRLRPQSDERGSGEARRGARPPGARPFRDRGDDRPRPPGPDGGRRADRERERPSRSKGSATERPWHGPPRGNRPGRGGAGGGAKGSPKAGPRGRGR